MRTNNGKVKNIIISVYFVLIVLSILLATVFSAFQDLTSNPYLTFFIILGVFIFIIVCVYLVSKYFEYDSDGVKVVLINRGLLLADHFNYRERKAEFEKHKLVRFRIYDYILYKQLVIWLNRSDGSKKRYCFNVTLVTRKKRKYIKQSLSKIIKENRKLYKQ